MSAHDEVPVTQARAALAELVNRVRYGGERIVMTRHGRPLAALVPAEDLERLEELEHRAGQERRSERDAGPEAPAATRAVSEFGITPAPRAPAPAPAPAAAAAAAERFGVTAARQEPPGRR